jgi:DNA-binding transcriptional LysR family regulator
MVMLDSRLRYLVAVARSGSFTAAAQAAGVTQSAITKSIADLEKEIGYSVFYRTSRGVILTEQGGDFVKRVSRLLEDARELLQSGPTNRDPYAGVLRIGVCPASLEWRLVDPLAELLQRHRAVRYEISSANFETVVQHLRSGTLDVAVGFDAAFGEWADLRREPMGTLKSALFVRTGHPLLGKDKITRRDLAEYDFVSPSESRPYGEVIRDLYESHGIDWHSRVHRADFFPVVRRIVEQSDAIGVVAWAYAQSDHFAERFVLLPYDDFFPIAPLCCAVRARWEPKAATRAFIAIVKRSFPSGT